MKLIFSQKNHPPIRGMRGMVFRSNIRLLENFSSNIIDFIVEARIDMRFVDMTFSFLAPEVNFFSPK